MQVPDLAAATADALAGLVPAAAPRRRRKAALAAAPAVPASAPAGGGPDAAPGAGPAGARALGAAHRRRLRDLYRSAGWPCHDALEVDLLAAGLLVRVPATHGCDTLRLTDAGIALLAETHAGHRARRDPHEALVARVATEMTRNGRLAWRGLVVRALTPGGWALAMPDVYSVRHTTVEAYLEPVVHEIKVRRSDLLADLRKPDKRAAYLDLGACWYVLADGIAEPDEVPACCGVMVASGERLQVVRAAERRPARMAFGTWMALARATPVEGFRFDEAQLLLGDAGPDRVLG